MTYEALQQFDLDTAARAMVSNDWLGALILLYLGKESRVAVNDHRFLEKYLPESIHTAVGLLAEAGLILLSEDEKEMSLTEVGKTVYEKLRIPQD